jgi:hypothetical protein
VLHKRERPTPLSREETKVAGRRRIVTLSLCQLRSIFDPSICDQSADEYLLNFELLVEKESPH